MTIRLVWQPMGVAKLAEAAFMMTMAKGSKLTSSRVAAATAMGNTRAAAGDDVGEQRGDQEDQARVSQRSSPVG